MAELPTGTVTFLYTDIEALDIGALTGHTPTASRGGDMAHTRHGTIKGSGQPTSLCLSPS